MSVERKHLVADLPGGIQLTYIDSGPVPNSNDFSTLVQLHGCHFNAYTFEHLLPLAHKYNIRLVVVQRRDYAGSSQYTDEEMRLLRENPTLFFQNAGAVFVHFLHYIVKNTHVCKPTEDRSRGGISLAAWSLGCAYAMSTFAEDSAVDQAIRDAIDPYITALVLYDPPYVAIGALLPNEDRLFDPFDLPPERQKEGFRNWVSSYYDRSSKSGESLLELNRQGETDKRTTLSWTEEQYGKWTEFFPLRSETVIINDDNVHLSLNKIASDVFFGLNRQTTGGAFPLARVVFIRCEQSVWMTGAARDALVKKRSELAAQGQEHNLRRVDFTNVDWANHFIHFDAPEEFLKIVEGCLRRV